MNSACAGEDGAGLTIGNYTSSVSPDQGGSLIRLDSGLNRNRAITVGFSGSSQLISGTSPWSYADQSQNNDGTTKFTTGGADNGTPAVASGAISFPSVPIDMSGDSLIADSGGGPQGSCYLDRNLYNPPFSPIYNEGISGQSLSYLATVWGAQCGIYSPTITGTLSTALQEGGHNDLHNSGLTALQTYSNWITLINKWQGGGFTPIFACTQTRSYYLTGTYETYRLAYNTLMRTYCQNPENGVMLIDLDNEYPVNTGTALYPNPEAPYQSDGLHYTQVLESAWGQQIMDLQTLNNGLVAMYHLDEASGTFYDCTLDHYDLTASSTGTTTGQVNGAAVLSGSSDSFLANPNLTFSGTAFSFAMWVNPNAASSPQGAVLAGNDSLGNSSVTCYLQPDNTFSCVARIGGALITARDAIPNALPANTWSFCTAIYDGSQLTIQTGANAPVSVAASGTVGTYSGSFIVGNWNSFDLPFKGSVDEVGVWNRAITSGTESTVISGSTITSDERAQLWNLGYGRPYKPFVTSVTLPGARVRPNFPIGFSNAGLTMTLNNAGGGAPVIVDGLLELTDGALHENRSAFFTGKVNVTRFVTQFDFLDTNADSDGFTFCIQGNSAVATGEAGANLGYAGMLNSVAIKFDIASGLSATGLCTNGVVPPGAGFPAVDTTAAGVDFHNGHVMHVVLSYQDGTLNQTITDLTTNAVFNQAYDVDIPAITGASDGTAWVGFTAGTSGSSSIQHILGWKFVNPPAVPSDLHVTSVGTSTIDLLWTDNSTDETGFKLYLVNQDTGDETLLAALGANTTSYTGFNLDAGTDFNFLLRAYNIAGSAGSSSVASATLCNAPADLSATPMSSNVSLLWTPSGGAVTYNIYRSTISGGEEPVPYLTGITGPDFTDNAVATGTRYYYKVSAVNDQGAEGPLSAEVSAMPGQQDVPAMGPVVLAVLALLLFLAAAPSLLTRVADLKS